MGSEAFIGKLEPPLGRRLGRRKSGPKPKKRKK